MFRPGNKIGIIGENIAARFLMKQGFSIKERNYWKKWGEIDVVAEKEGIVHFVEVKSVSCENIENVLSGSYAGYRPEENVHEGKLSRLYKTIESYIAEYEYEGEWGIDVIIVYIEKNTKRAKVKMIENIT